MSSSENNNSGARSLDRECSTTVLFLVSFRVELVLIVDRFEDTNRLIRATGLTSVIDQAFSFSLEIEALQYLESQKHVRMVVVDVLKRD